LRIDKTWPFTAFVVLLSAGLVFRELWSRHFGRIHLKTLLPLIVGVFSAALLVSPSFTRGAFVSVTGDTFLYSAFGQYLTDHHRGINFGLPPIDQYATLQSETRFGTASILGFLSILFHSSTAAVLPVYIFVALVHIFSGFVLVSRQFGCNRLFSLAAGLFSVIGGWTPNALNIAGLDNLLFLSLFPFLVVRLEMYRFGSKTLPTSLAIVILSAGLFYVYPEGLAIAGVIFLPFFCDSLWSGMYRQGRAWRRYLISAGLILILISPYFRVFYTSLSEHIEIGRVRGASGIFPGLLSPRFLPAIFGFGQEYPGTTYSSHDLILPITMLAFIALGCATWIRRKKSLVLSFSLLIIMATWQGCWQQYDYGLYKIIFIGSLIWIPSLFRGGTAGATFVPRPTRPFAVTLGTITFFSAALAQRMEQQEKIPWRQVVPMKCFSELAGLRHKVGHRPVLLVCDSAFDPEYFAFDQEWAVFFLRNVNIKVPEYFGYLGAFRVFMQRAQFTTESPDFVLVSERMEDAVWQNERFSLLALSSQPTLIGVQGPHALEHLNGQPFVWLGNEATRFLIVSKMAQTAHFSAVECLTGPSCPRDKDRHIHISIGGNVWKVNLSEVLSIEVPLKPGLNMLAIACQEFPAFSPQSKESDTKFDSTDIVTEARQVPAQPNGDAEEHPLGLWDYRISSKEGKSN
jgi:hypothetical protein